MSTPTEKQYLKFIFQTVLRTQKAPTIEEMSTAFKKPDAQVIDIFDRLEEQDLLLRKKGTQEIMSIYPLSLVPTEHKIILENGTALYAMCADDALGIPVTFRRNVTITSQCEKCKQKIIIEIKNEEIVSILHPKTMIWNPKRLIAPAAEMCCPLVNFFCSKSHLEECGPKKTLT